MIKKTLLYSAKVIKLSMFLGAIVTLFSILIVAFFLLYPALIKTPIEAQLSKLSKTDVKLSRVSFDFEQNTLVLKAHNIKINAQNDKPMAQIEHLYWSVNFLDLLNDSYYPSEIYMDTLTLYSGDTLFDFSKTITPEFVNNLGFFKSLSINKTRIKNHFELILAPLHLIREESGFVLKIPNQNMGVKNVDIVATFSIDQFMKDGLLQVFATLSNADFTLQSQVQIYQDNADNWIALNGEIERIEATNIAQYFLTKWVGEATSQWLKDAFVSGSIEAVKIKLKKNLSQATPLELKLSAHSNNLALLFHPEWQTLQHLDADIMMDAKDINIDVNSAQLNGLNLQDMQVQIADFSAATSKVEVRGELHNNSEDLVAFLSLTPLEEVRDVLGQFKISGKASTQVYVALPLDESEPTIDVDLQVHNNRLQVLNGKVVVEDYNSDAAFHQGRITTQGVGTIRNNVFEININPDADAKNDFVIEIGQTLNNFKASMTNPTENKWLAEVNSPNIKSQLSIDLSQPIPQVSVQNLRIDTTKSNTTLLNLQPNDFPNMHLQAKNIRIDDYRFPDFKVDLYAQKKALSINNLELEGIGVNQNNLSFNGHWLQDVTTLIATAKGEKLSDLLQQLKIQEKVIGGAFDFDLRVFCACSPWDMNLKNISGHASMRVKDGVFSEQGPNFGKVLSLLNIESIAKRLKLKVDDLRHKGFVYDDIQIEVYLQDALLRLANFQVNASSSTIQLSGNSDIVNQQYDILATVRPAIGNSVPVATYLAGGGLTGLGIWVADKVLFDGKIMQSVVDSVAEFDYKITGSWDNPIITK